LEIFRWRKRVERAPGQSIINGFEQDGREKMSIELPGKDKK
jgi:hypothetical protein